jgi:hypothetical protein
MQAAVAPIRDELNAADRELGDGDTGMTVEELVTAWSSAAPDLPEDVGEALRKLAQATRRASGSSLASVAAMALGAAGKAAAGRVALDGPGLAAALDAAAAAIGERSGAAPGDKTVLDSLLAVAAAMRAPDGDARVAAEAALVEFRGRECRLGRARMYGARTVGRDDPGMLAAARLLRAALENPA